MVHDKEKPNVLLNRISDQILTKFIYILKIHSNYVKDLFKSKCQLFINGKENVGIKKLKNPEAFINYSQTIFMKI